MSDQLKARSEIHPDQQAANLGERLTAWAGTDPMRWKRIHTALLQIYRPVWEGADARDILVAWAAAWRALTRAQNELARFRALGRLLTRREGDIQAGRRADVSFWGRCAPRLQARLADALSEDLEASRMLDALIGENRPRVSESMGLGQSTLFR